MSTDLRTALHDLADGKPRPAPPAEALWARGRRRTRTRRAAAGATVAAVAGLVAVAVWPGTPPTAPSQPLTPPSVQEPSTLPDAVALPPFTPDLAERLGRKAMALSDDDGRFWVVDGTGDVARVGPAAPTFVALSPDGRWLSRWLSVIDLTTGKTVEPTGPVADRHSSAQGQGLWSPDSKRVYVDSSPTRPPAAMGVVLGTDGRIVEVPLTVDQATPTFVAGWLDDDTLLGFERRGTGSTRLVARTWTLGDRAWTPGGLVITWPRGSGSAVAGSISPSGRRVLIRWRSDVDGISTGAMMFDAKTGKHVGMPMSTGEVDPTKWAVGSTGGWPGWGCRPAWRGDRPVITDGKIAALAEKVDPSIPVSSRFRLACASFAGDRVGEQMVPNRFRAVQEWVWFRGLPGLAGLGALTAAAWAGQRAVRRRRA